MRNQYSRGDCLKTGDWQFADLRDGLGKKEEGGVFEGEVDTPKHITIFHFNKEISIYNNFKSIYFFSFFELQSWAKLM